MMSSSPASPRSYCRGTMSSPSAARVAREESDDGVENGNDAIDNGHDDATNRVDNSHDSAANGAQDRLHLERGFFSFSQLCSFKKKKNLGGSFVGSGCEGGGGDG